MAVGLFLLAIAGACWLLTGETGGAAERFLDAGLAVTVIGLFLAMMLDG